MIVFSIRYTFVKITYNKSTSKKLVESQTVNKHSTSCLRTGCPKTSTSLKQLNLSKAVFVLSYLVAKKERRIMPISSGVARPSALEGDRGSRLDVPPESF